MSTDLLQPLRDIAAHAPGRKALLSPGRPDAHYGELLAFMDDLHSQLDRLGVRPGARVATLLPNAAETAVLVLALCSHATAIPLNPDDNPETIRRALGAAGATHLIVQDGTSLENLDGITVLLLKPLPQAATGQFALAPADANTSFPAMAPSPDALVLHTSGSTSAPKRVPLTVENLSCSAWNVARSLDLGETDLCLNMMPMFHIGAVVDLLLAPLYAGGSVVFAPVISAAAFLDAASRYRPTWFQAVPTVLRDILNSDPAHADPAAIAALRFIRVVSQALPERLRQDFEARFGVSLVPIYGMTETAGLIASVPLEAASRKPGSVGRAAGPQLRIAADRGHALPVLEIGEVQVRGPNVMRAYETDDSETFQGDWLRTGDTGYLDEDGFLFLTGRLKDIINRGGEKIAPAELDRILLEHSEIAEAAAFAVPHASLGEEAGVAVVRTAGATLDEAAVIAFLRARLAAHKLPRRVLFLAKLPRLPSGKLDRRGLAVLHADAFRGSQIFVRPETDTAKRIAAIWCHVLRRPEVGMDDDFFDLGGDSLSATNLVLQLEQVFGPVAALDLFETPTVRSMEARLKTLPALPQSASGDDKLVVTRNRTGWKTPFFWVIGGVRQFDALAGSFDPARPLHGLGVFLPDHLRPEQIAALAAPLADQIEEQQPAGPVLLGGFCRDGKIALRVANALRQRGREISLLCLQDCTPPELYEGRTALFWSRRSRYTLYYSHVRPERGLGAMLRGPVAQWGMESDHRGLYEPPQIGMFARQLHEALAAAEDGSDIFAPLPQRPALERAAYSARIRASAPRLMRQGKDFCLAVTVTNKSPVTWQPTQESGIVLAARWHVFDDRYGLLLDGHAELPQPIAPGQSCVLDLALRMPMRGLPMRLEVDLLEDGVRWFGAGRKRLVFPLPPA